MEKLPTKRLRPTQRQPAQKDPFPMRKFIPKVQSRAAIATIFAYCYASYEKAVAMLKMLNRHGDAFVANNDALQQMLQKAPNEAKIMRHICTVKPLGLAPFNEVDFTMPTRAQLKELLLFRDFEQRKDFSLDKRDSYRLPICKTQIEP